MRRLLLAVAVAALAAGGVTAGALTAGGHASSPQPTQCTTLGACYEAMSRQWGIGSQLLPDVSHPSPGLGFRGGDSTDPKNPYAVSSPFNLKFQTSTSPASTVWLDITPHVSQGLVSQLKERGSFVTTAGVHFFGTAATSANSACYWWFTDGNYVYVVNARDPAGGTPEGGSITCRLARVLVDHIAPGQ